VSARPLSYAVVTPVRNEEENLPRLAAAMAAQDLPPRAWVIVDTGSTDATPNIAAALSAAHPWVHVASSAGSAVPTRGGPIVRAFTAGLRGVEADVICKLDADLSFGPDYFARLLEAFAADDALGIASGICHERDDAGAWQPIYGTRSHVWGAARAYRQQCLRDVLPLEERQGWDEIDAIKAQIRGWRVGTLHDLPFRHHRPEGARDGGHRRWSDQGETAHFMGYRFGYLLARTLYRAPRDPASVAMLSGYARAAARRAPRCGDAAVVAHLRTEQAVRRLPVRVREAFGRAA
jgi:glycosyltransferase involved in cell wall biosynthesis